jgi:FG-GAP-like repeat
VLLGNGDGTFRSAVKYAMPGDWVGAVYPGDFNGDGRPDLAVATSTVINNVYSTGLAILMNKGDGTLRLGQKTANVSPLGTADFNHDGNLDLAVSNQLISSLSLSVLYGSGNGTFTQSGPAVSIPSGTSSVTIQDFNEDGYPDIALTYNNYDVTLMGSLAVFLSKPEGGFLPPIETRQLDTAPVSICSGDFNHDGHVDVAVVTSEIDVLFGHGDGTFSYRSVYGTDGPSSIAPNAADLNGDGYLDLVTINSGGTVSPLFGKPGGTFNAEVYYPLAPFAGYGATLTADFNRDGIADVAVLNYANVSVLMGQANGHLKPTGALYKIGPISQAGQPQQNFLVISNTCATPLAPGASCTVTLQFNLPSNYTSTSVILKITDNYQVIADIPLTWK